MYEADASVYLSKGTAFNIVCDTIRQVRSRGIIGKRITDIPVQSAT